MAWQQAIELVDLVYEAARNWPRYGTYGLAQQIQRATVSIAANIAEGQGRNGKREFLHHLGIANGSLCEVETLLIIGLRQRYITAEQEATIFQQSRRVASLLNGLMNSIKPD